MSILTCDMFFISTESMHPTGKRKQYTTVLLVTHLNSYSVWTNCMLLYYLTKWHFLPFYQLIKLGDDKNVHPFKRIWKLNCWICAIEINIIIKNRKLTTDFYFDNQWHPSLHLLGHSSFQREKSLRSKKTVSIYIYIFFLFQKLLVLCIKCNASPKRNSLFFAVLIHGIIPFLKFQISSENCR